MVIIVIAVITACSAQKNTAKSRWWQSFTAKYNTYYNGTLAYIDGSLEKERGNKDNYTEIIPLYTVGNKNSRSLGSGNFDRAIEKCQKAIKLHSIKKRPEWTKSRRKTERDIEWLNRREYNPMMWKAWMLMGRSQFYKGAFDEAAATFSYMSRMYQTQPAIYGKARAWLAKSYIEQEWLYDAEDVIRNMSRDSLDWRAVKEWDYTYADYYIHTGEYEKAIPYLEKVIKHEMRRKQRAREWFLMGQLQAELGHKDLAYKAFKKVVKQNPPYELEFNARIAMTEVMAAGRAKQTISRLKRMAANDNNKEYLDQVYYALGNVYLLEKDTVNAIGAYEKGNEKSTRNGIEKGVLLLKLGDLYWEIEKFGDAQRCYGAAIGMLDKERKDYEELSRRSQILDELAPHTESIHLQDSLLALADMPEKERNEAIDRVIEALKKKEKEEKKAQQEQEAQEVTARNSAVGNRNQNQQNQQQNQQQPKGEWYFYNQQAISQGKTKFQQQWGKRENVDNWQRVNKTVVGDMGENTDNENDIAANDSIGEGMEERVDSVGTEKKDSVETDPHKREYYLAQIPFTDEQKAECHSLISDGLFHSGIIFKDRLDNLRLSEKQFDRLTSSYPEFEKMDEVYYHLFLLYSRKGETMRAEQYIELLKDSFPDSQWTTILSDPYYAENSKFGVHMEDSLYAATYDAFRHDRYSEVYGNANISEKRFPLGANRDKFVFIRGLSRLNDGDAEACLEDMNYVVKNFPSSRISEMAGMIVNGVNSGRRLHGGKFDLGDVWSRRSVVLSDSDSINARKFVADRNKDFLFILAYHPDSLNENQLLFEMARFNFTNFIVRNFDITITDDDGIHRMEISGFRNFDEAHQYAEEVFSKSNIVNRMRKARSIIISSENLEILGKQYSYDEYDEFYAKHFAPLRVSNDDLLSEPLDIGEGKEPDLSKGRPTDNAADDTDDGMIINDNSDATEDDDNGFDLPDESENNSEVQQEEEEGTFSPDIPVAPKKPIEPIEPTSPVTPEDNDDGLSIPDNNNGGQSFPDDDDDGGFSIPDDNGGQNLPDDDDNGLSIPDDNGGQNLPSDDDNGLSIPDDNQSSVPSTGNGLYELNKDVIITPRGNNNNDDDNEYILQSKRKDNNNGNKQSNGVIHQKDNRDLPLKEMKNQEQQVLELPTASDEKTPAANKKKKEQPKQEAKPTQKEQPKQEVEDTGIDFDDEFMIDIPTQPSTSKKKKKEPVEFDLDDEYYELDGF